MRRILVTGGEGFLGKRLVKKLKKKGLEVLIFDQKSNPKHTLLDKKMLLKNIEEVDTVFHLAAINNPTEKRIFDVNVIGTKNLSEVIKKKSPGTKIIFTSSFAVYKPPKKGETINENYPLLPRNNYGLSKLKAEKVLSKYSKEGLSVVILRISNIYGYGMPPFGHSVVSTLLESAKKGKAVKIHGDGRQTRDFVFVEDVVEALIKGIEVKKRLSVINVCSGKETSIRELISIMKKTTKKNIKVEYDKSNKDQGYWKGDNGRAEKILNWMPKTPLENGIRLIWGKMK